MVERRDLEAYKRAADEKVTVTPPFALRLATNSYSQTRRIAGLFGSRGKFPST